MIPGATNNGGLYEKPEKNEDKDVLLPPWATEAQIVDAGYKLANEVARALQRADNQLHEAEHEAERKEKEIDKQVTNWAPILERETEAFLTHIAEGW